MWNCLFFGMFFFQVRVHSVLKQQKEKTGPKTDSVQEELRR